MLAKFAKFAPLLIAAIILGTAVYVFVSNNLVVNRGQVVITDKDVSPRGGDPVGEMDAASVTSTAEPAQETPGTTSQSIARTLGDLSTVTTVADGYGNRTETRVFRGDPKLRMVMVKYGSHGEEFVYVYGKNGGVKTMSKLSAADALAMSADELANKAEFFETALDKERQKPKLSRQREDRLAPLSSSEIEMKPVRAPETDEPTAQIRNGSSESDDGT